MIEHENRSPTRLLIVDSDPNELKMLMIGLELEGFEVKGADSSSRAVQLLESSRFDIALIDLMMPEMNGLQLARAVRSAAPGVTTILMSAYHLSPVQLARADTGAVGFVPKPFLFDDLVSFIRAKTQGSSVPAPPVTEHSPILDPSGLHVPFDVPELA